MTKDEMIAEANEIKAALANAIGEQLWRLGDPFASSPSAEQPAQRKPLTDEQIDELSRTMVKGDNSVYWLCRAIEAAHGIKE